MTEKIRRVAVDGPPDPDEHPWVMWRRPGHTWTYRQVRSSGAWGDGGEWYPVPAPPNEYLTVDEGVEVDGRNYRVNGNAIEWLRNPLTEYEAWHVWLPLASVIDAARVAQALGLVDQPNVEWVR